MAPGDQAVRLGAFRFLEEQVRLVGDGEAPRRSGRSSLSVSNMLEEANGAMRLAASCFVLALCAAGCGGHGVSSMRGGAPPCTLDGPVVEDARLRPAKPLREIGGRMITGLHRVLPVSGTRLQARLRVDEIGRITSQCPVGDVEPDLWAAALRYFATGLWPPLVDHRPPTDSDPTFAPATLNGRNVPSAVTVSFWWDYPGFPDGMQPSDEAKAIWKSTSARALESLVSAGRGPLPDLGEERDSAGTAYARLGQLNTAAARRAIARIESAARDVAVDLPRAVLDDRYGHRPGESDPVKTVKAPDGCEYSFLYDRLVGFAMALTWRKSAADPWRRPVLLPLELRDGQRFFETVQLTTHPGGRIDIEYEEVPWRFSPDNPTFRPVRRSLATSLSDLARDSDADGWTDIEEQRMGLDPRNPDTDGDGIPDGRDQCPNWRSRNAAPADETEIILQKTALALFGLPGAERFELLLAGPNAHRISLIGLAGPLVYGRATDAKSAWGSGACWVDWRIVRRTATEATVEFTRATGDQAGRWYEVYLYKQGGTWVVVLVTLLGLS
jgi:hypothetical protein